MRARRVVILVLAGALPAAAGTVDVKSAEATAPTASSALPTEKLLAPGDPSFVLDLIEFSTESVIQLGPTPRDDCYGGNLFFSDSASGLAGPRVCP